MSSGREAFGPNLRRMRLQRGISLNDIAHRTKVSAELWAGLERNDLSRWPSGIFARAYVREYAHALGIDAEVTVDEFCRCFPQGDRRARRIVKGQAELVGHELQWSDDLPVPDRRTTLDAIPEEQPRVFPRRERLLIGVADIAVVAAFAGINAVLVPIGFWASLGVIAVAYHVASLTMLGCSPAVRVAEWYFSAKRPQAQGAPTLRLLRGSERVKV